MILNKINIQCDTRKHEGQQQGPWMPTGHGSMGDQATPHKDDQLEVCSGYKGSGKDAEDIGSCQQVMEPAGEAMEAAGHGVTTR